MFRPRPSSVPEERPWYLKDITLSFLDNTRVSVSVTCRVVPGPIVTGEEGLKDILSTNRVGHGSVGCAPPDPSFSTSLSSRQV